MTLKDNKTVTYFLRVLTFALSANESKIANWKCHLRVIRSANINFIT